MPAFKFVRERKHVMNKENKVVRFPNNSQNSDSSNDHEEYNEELKEIAEFVRAIKRHSKMAKVILGVVGTAVLGCIAYFYSIGAKFDSINVEFDSIDVRLDSMDARLDSMDKSIDDFKEETAKELQDMKGSVDKLNDKVDGISNDVNMIKGTLYGTDCYKAGNEFVSALTTLCADTTQKEWRTDTIVAVDEKTGIAFSAGELSGERLLLNYTVDGYENLFYGQFSENNHWDGECIINSYKDGELWFIADTEYDDGNLLRYRQVFEAEQVVTIGGKSSTEAVWVVSERECVDGVYIGESTSYLRAESVLKDFEIEDADVTNVIGTGQFIQRYMSVVVSYYSGDTANGAYEDNSGDAYLVKYDDNGKVVLLYKGGFEDGNMNDKTGKAWYVLWEGTEYVYYNGNFEDGHRADNDGLEHITSYNRLSELTLGKGFSCKLDWHDFQET